jgi:RNA polymerase sigma-70 factor (ECF subfamily)
MVADYRAQVFRLALSILDQPDDAEDATQDTFIQAARSLHRYQPGTNFRAWILRITVNTCRSLIRKRLARANLRRILGAQQALTGRPAGPEALAAERLAHSQLWDLVDCLPEKQRLVVILHLAHDLPVAEVAQILGASPKTVYSRLYAAYRRLRGEIHRAGGSILLENE